MKKKKTSGGWIIVVLAVALIVFMVRHFHIKNFNIIEPEVLYTSGQPRGMDYTRLLYKYHIATIVSVRISSEHREHNWYHEELTWVRNNGVKYEELPIDRSIDRSDYFPDSTTQRQFLKLMSDKQNLPVLVHSGSGRKRVAMLAAVWSIKGKGLSVDETAKIVKKIKDKQVTEKEMKFLQELKN
ncbi:MAG: phosphatase domain-containing protein [Planctomycetota bacterium]|jgi:protein tyrosine phosphatase (PTP) superfamily phosphohydrolase (DUF442 family)